MDHSLFFFSSRRRHTRFDCDWSSDVCSSDLFVGEFLVLVGAFRTYPRAAIVAAAGVIVAAMYLLPALQRVIYNPLAKHENGKLSDLSPREIAVLAPLVACILWIGVCPAPLPRPP